LIAALTIAAKDSHRENPFSDVEGPLFESSSDSEWNQILSHEHSDQTQKRLCSDEEKPDPIEGS
jgi:hypothetical protein